MKNKKAVATKRTKKAIAMRQVDSDNLTMSLKDEQTSQKIRKSANT